jgi:hypothetical protein
MWPFTPFTRRYRDVIEWGMARPIRPGHPFFYPSVSRFAGALLSTQ